MRTLLDVRRAIKPLGYKLKTKSVSWGRAATYIDIETGAELSFNAGNSAQWEKWIKINNWRKDHRTELKAVREYEGCIGLV